MDISALTKSRPSRMDILKAVPWASMRRAAIALTTSMLLMAMQLPVMADSVSVEYQVKAAYLAKFGYFVDWSKTPAAQSHATVLCVAGDDPFGDALESVTAGQRIGERTIVIRRLKSVTRDSGCDILYLGELDGQSLEEALDALNGVSVLTVTDAARGDGRKAGIIDFVVQNNRVRFNIDDEAAARNGITISSHLLNLALSVKHRS